MAISKVQYKEDANATPVVWMDTTDKTVTQETMLSGCTALQSDGTTATGIIPVRSSSDVTVSNGSVTISNGMYFNSVTKTIPAGTAGTPVITKGEVNNHSISIAASVTNTSGYIQGGTIVGSAVTVDVDELESGTKSITENGSDISVSGYSKVDVNVPGYIPTLISKTITQNGTYAAANDEADGYSSVTVNATGYTRTVVCPLQTFTTSSNDGYAALSNASRLVNGEEYIITYDNVEYLCSCKELWGSDRFLGDLPLTWGSIGEMYIFPFVIEDWNSNPGPIVYARDHNQHSIKIELLERPNGGVLLGTKTISNNGTYNASSDNLTGYSNVTVDISGVERYEEGVLRFIDYDGTTLDTYTSSQALTLQALPSNPSHTGLVAQGWNWALADIKSFFAENPYSDLDVGQMYITSDNSTKIGINIDDDSFKHIVFGLTVNGTIYIDWGDSSPNSTLSQAGIFGTVSHTYTDTGRYVISIYVNNGNTATITGSGSANYVSNYYTRLFANQRSSSIIENISIGANMTLGNGALNYCSALQTITLPNSLTSIPDNCFRYTYTLKQCTIPSSVQTIGTYAFYRSKALISIPDSITSIGAYAFSYTTLRSVVLRNATTIGEYAFYNCLQLYSAVLSDFITTLNSFMFYYCYSLRIVKLPATLITIEDRVFGYNQNLKEINIPNTVTSIGIAAFTQCRSLRKINLSTSLLSIGNDAFEYCYSLYDITLPDTLRTIGSYAFQECSSLYEITIPNSVTLLGEFAFTYCYHLHNVTILANLSTINQYTFYLCHNIITIQLPQGITTIQASAFSGNDSLENISMPSTVTTIANSAFMTCERLRNITLPSYLQTIGDRAFANNSSLEEIIIPNTVTQISSYAFQQCYSLKHVVLSNNITSIPNYCFQNCSYLHDVEFPSGITSIESYAFTGCTSFSVVRLPSRLSSISGNAFTSCTNIKEYHLTSETPPAIATNSLAVYSDTIIYVPYSDDHSILQAYKTATNWSTYASKMQEEAIT